MFQRGRNLEQGGVGQEIDVFKKFRNINYVFKFCIGINLIYFGKINLIILIKLKIL